MAGHNAGSQHQFTRLRKYFSTYTITGRINDVIATYAMLASIILYFKPRPKNKTPAMTQK
uniref:ATP synthase membrane subunit DAPIT n=1 Tax=Podarcis muralis TaxID=64176 RepID=A0A670ID23_PODMU